MKSTTLASIALLASITSASTVQAQGFQIGIMGGQSNLDDLANTACAEVGAGTADFFSSATCITGDDDIAFGFNAAYYFSEVIGIEAGYVNLGKSSFTTESPYDDAPFGFPPALITTDFSTNVVYGALAGTLPLTDRLSITGKIGVYEASLDVEVDDGFYLENFELESTSDTYFGGSINYEVIDNLSLQLRHDHFEVEVTSVGLSYAF